MLGPRAGGMGTGSELSVVLHVPWTVAREPPVDG